MTAGCALVTGGSRGLGAAIASRLAADGWPVVINFAHDTVGAVAVAERVCADGCVASISRFDVTDDDEVGRAVAAIAAEHGGVSIVVNNATGPQPMIPLVEQTWDDHLDQLKFFVKAPLLLLQAVLPHMRSAGYGRVINIGSEAADIGNKEFGHYVAAKAAMHGLTRSWARELGADGITVNTIEPGWIPVERHKDVDSADLRGYTDGVPLGRQGSPADVASMVAYLASPAAGFITGQRFAVNGGNTMA